MNTSILIVVAAVVILIIAVVVVTIFTGGIERFLRIWGVFSTDQLVKSSCQTKCQELCSLSGTKSGQPQGWGGIVKVGGADYACSNYGFTCDCSKYIPGTMPGITIKKGKGEPCTKNEECQSSSCVNNKCA